MPAHAHRKRTFLNDGAEEEDEVRRRGINKRGGCRNSHAVQRVASPKKRENKAQDGINGTDVGSVREGEGGGSRVPTDERTHNHFHFSCYSRSLSPLFAFHALLPSTFIPTPHRLLPSNKPRASAALWGEGRGEGGGVALMVRQGQVPDKTACNKG